MRETLDPDGRRVVLTWSQWNHIRREHRALGMARDALLDIVASPDERIPGRKEGEEWFYRRKGRAERVGSRSSYTSSTIAV